MPRPLRTSCDRCHSQKLKCPKQASSATCTICAKAGAVCVFSPAGVHVRRNPVTHGDETGLVLPQHQIDFDMDLDWSTLEFNDHSTSIPTTQVTTSHELEFPPPNPRAVCVEQLSKLALDIDRVCSLVPPDLSIHMPKDERAAGILALCAEKSSQRQSLEQLFASAQRLMDLYPSTMNSCSGNQ